MKIISSEDYLPAGLSIMWAPSYGLCYSGARWRWLVVWHPRHGFRYGREREPS